MCLQGSWWTFLWSSSPSCSKQSCTPANPAWPATGPARRPAWPPPLETRPPRPPESRDWSPLLWMWQAASLFFVTFFFIYLLHDRAECMLIYTVHMLLYKTNARRCIGLWSLQVCIQFAQCVSVAIVRARLWKSLFYSDRGRIDTCDECFETTSGRCYCYFQVPFLAVKWRVAQSKTKSLRMLWHLNQRLNVQRSCINQRLKIGVLLHWKCKIN